MADSSNSASSGVRGWIQITGNNDNKKVGRVSSFGKFMGSPSRSPSSKTKSPSNKPSSPWARLNPARILRRSTNSGKRLLESEGSIKDDKNKEEEAIFQEATSEVVQSLAEKIKEEATQTTKPNDEAIKPTEPKDSSSGERIYNVEVVEKRDVPTSKVEPAAEKPKEEVREKGNETIQRTEESPEKKMISKDAVIETKDRKSLEDDQHPHTEEATDGTTSSDADSKNPIVGAEGINTIVATPRDQDDEKKDDSFYCVSSLAKGLQSLCAPQTAK
ncbi:hypothetical protein Cgig2_016687 [Carnegiea gigantea]|uniref:Uncharacterized protein n=1 Tax=Carnegiea gigantea TaxID=171969 RepID=A0A9Q1L0D4_9CARY|nr:hypothetical protein Cgig2_016687 [Carnegiea gigantea]